MECMYCKARAINAEMFIVRKATKPKGAQHRWEKIGFCCESCESAGKPTDIEFEARIPAAGAEGAE